MPLPGERSGSRREQGANPAPAQTGQRDEPNADSRTRGGQNAGQAGASRRSYERTAAPRPLKSVAGAWTRAPESQKTAGAEPRSRAETWAAPLPYNNPPNAGVKRPAGRIQQCYKIHCIAECGPQVRLNDWLGGVTLEMKGVMPDAGELKALGRVPELSETVAQ